MVDNGQGGCVGVETCLGMLRRGGWSEGTMLKVREVTWEPRLTKGIVATPLFKVDVPSLTGVGDMGWEWIRS